MRVGDTSLMIKIEKLSEVLVTGGTGFIGSHLVDSLMKKGVHVKVVDNLSTGNAENMESWLDHTHFQFIHGDLKDPAVARGSIENAELVFHLAANSEVRVGETEPEVHFNENLVSTFNLLEAMRKSEKARLIVFSSSSTVYGEPDTFPTPEDYGPLLPISVYGASKLGCESLIGSYCHTFGLKGTILRFANIVGSRATHGVIVDFIKKLTQNRTGLEILGDGTQTKSYLHVDDLIQAIFSILNSFHKKRNVDTYNVGSTDQTSVIRIAEIVCEEMEIKHPKFTFNNAYEDGRGWKGDVKTMQLSIEKITNVGWKPSLNSEEAVRLGCKELLQAIKH